MPRWESDGEIVLMRLGNSGGGKDPDFWSAFEDGEDRVIGDEPATPEKIRILQRKLYRKSKAEPGTPAVCYTGVGLNAGCHAMNPIGEPDAGDRHVRF